MRSLPTALALVLCLALAGCNGDEGSTPTTVTCPGGAVVEVPANHTGEPHAACPPPTPPSIVLRGVGDGVTIFKPVTFSWDVDAGEHKGGHSMLTSIRVSPVSQPSAAALAGPDSYGVEAARKEHQNLPVNATAEYTFTTPGTYYVRAYATIQGDDLDAADYWTPELTLTVADVAATGNDTVVVHPVGNSAGAITPNPVSLRVGDGIVFQNDDLTPHTLTPATCSTPFDPVTVASMAASAPLVFKAPGTCTFTTDDVQPQTLTVDVGT